EFLIGKRGFRPFYGHLHGPIIPRVSGLTFPAGRIAVIIVKRRTFGLREFGNCRRRATVVLCLCLAQLCAAAASFDAHFETIKKAAGKAQLYAFLYDLPKGGDLHHHLGLSFTAEQWYAAATDPKRA